MNGIPLSWTILTSGDGEPPWSNDPHERTAFDPNFDEFGDYTQRAIQTLSILDDSSSTLTPCPTEVPPPGLLPRCLPPPHPGTSIKAPLALPQRDLCSTPLAYSNDDTTHLGLDR